MNSLDSVIRVIYGHARYLPNEPANSNVRRYDDDGNWIGVDTSHIDYYRDIETACADLPWLIADQGSYLFLDAVDGDGVTARQRLNLAETADLEEMFGDDWPDYTVYDASTGELLHVGYEHD